MTTPQQRDLITGRWRKVRAPKLSEFQIHSWVVAYLRQMIRADVDWWHNANGEYRGIRSGAKIKAMGGKAGLPDLTFAWPARWSFDPVPAYHHMEFKLPNKTLTHEQESFRDRALQRGETFSVVRSREEAVEDLEQHEIVRRRHGLDPIKEVRLIPTVKVMP